MASWILVTELFSKMQVMCNTHLQIKKRTNNESVWISIQIASVWTDKMIQSVSNDNDSSVIFEQIRIELFSY